MDSRVEVANLSEQETEKVKELEKSLGLVLVAYSVEKNSEKDKK